MPPRQIRFGPLDCIVVDGGPEPTVPVVLCHGYGAPGHDLAGLSLEWTERLGDAAEKFRFVFPAAPNDLSELGMPGGRAWWPINMAKLAELAETDRPEELYDQHPPGLDEARGMLAETIREVIASVEGVASVEGTTGGSESDGSNRDQSEPDVPLVLGGFSQGAMLAMDVSLRGPIEPPVALFQLSGALICQDVWKPVAGRLAETDVFQSHGTADPILPFAAAEALRDLLVGAGVCVDFYPFHGPHTIDSGAVTRTTEILRRVAAV